MLVRVNGTQEQNEAVRALLRIRMRCACMFDHTFLWQSSHPDNPKMDKDRTWGWMQQQWKHVQQLDPSAVVRPEDYEHFDVDVCTYRLWYSPEWPTDKIIGKRVRDDGTFTAADKWINRLIASISENGIIDPILAWNHVPSQAVKGWPTGTPITVLGSNRIAVAKHLGISTLPVIQSLPVGTPPKYGGEEISPEDLHDKYMNHRADLWIAPDDWYLVHPPTRFHDNEEGYDADPQQQMLQGL